MGGVRALYIPKKAAFVLETLKTNGYDAFLVGGCVRDSIMGKIPNDYDITTNATPEKILECFSSCKTLTNGIKHGTVGVILGKEVIEVTTYRIDGEYTDNRHPDKVMFSDKLTDDLSRRDFTVNAIACGHDLNFCDPFGGISDISRKLIKCVGEPDKRFNEDALRILRALRFSSVLDFDIDNDTALSVHKNAGLLVNISAERINSEFSKLICGKRSGRVLKEYLDVLCVFIPELCNIDISGYNAVVRDVELSECNLILRLCIFFGALLDKTDVSDVLTRLRYDNLTKNTVCGVVSIIDTELINDRIFVKKLISRIGFNNARLLNKVKYALGKSSIEQYQYFEENVNAIEISGECVFVSQLAINGQDCIDRIGIHGRNIGIILEKLCNDVIEEKIENNSDALISAATAYAEHLEDN